MTVLPHYRSSTYCNLAGYPNKVLPCHDKVKVKLLSETENIKIEQF